MFVSEAIGLNYINFPHHALPYFIVIITSVKKKKRLKSIRLLRNTISFIIDLIGMKSAAYT